MRRLYAIAFLLVQRDGGPYGMRRRERLAVKLAWGVDEYDAAGAAKRELEVAYPLDRGWGADTWQAIEVTTVPEHE